MPPRPARPKLREVVLDGHHAGQLAQDSHGRLTFTYDDAYRERYDATHCRCRCVPPGNDTKTV
jgi:HipA N-terminal domain